MFLVKFYLNLERLRAIAEQIPKFVEQFDRLSTDFFFSYRKPNLDARLTFRTGWRIAFGAEKPIFKTRFFHRLFLVPRIILIHIPMRIPHFHGDLLAHLGPFSTFKMKSFWRKFDAQLYLTSDWDVKHLFAQGVCKRSLQIKMQYWSLNKFSIVFLSLFRFKERTFNLKVYFEKFWMLKNHHNKQLDQSLKVEKIIDCLFRFLRKIAWKDL